MTRLTIKLLSPALLALIALTGCSSTSSRSPVVDEHFGDAVRFARAQQTLNPDASRNTDPVKGVDGRAAREAVERYETDFRKPQVQQGIFGIGVSGNTGGQ